MRGLSLTQPWATLCVTTPPGKKRAFKQIETRSWSTTYRGWVIIHAAKAFPRPCQELCYTQPFAKALALSGFNKPSDLPTAALLGAVYLHGCWPADQIVFGLNEEDRCEFAFGDYSAGRSGLYLRTPRPLTTPIPFKGALGLWTVANRPGGADALVEIERQLGVLA